MVSFGAIGRPTLSAMLPFRCPISFRLRVTLLSVSNVGVSFGATELFKNITFTVAQGERWGIIGRNGAGKTSIFRVITGVLQPTVGSVARKPGLRHALLDQHRAFEGATTVWQAGAAAWRDVMALEVGSQIMLDATPESLVELRCGDRTMFMGRMGRRGSRVAVSIESHVPRPEIG